MAGLAATLSVLISEYETPRGDSYRIFHHMESQVYLGEGFGHGPLPGPEHERGS